MRNSVNGPEVHWECESGGRKADRKRGLKCPLDLPIEPYGERHGCNRIELAHPREDRRDMNNIHALVRTIYRK